MSTRQKFLGCLVVGIVGFWFLGQIAWAKDEGIPSLAPINPAFKEYIEQVKAGKAPSLLTGAGHALGLLPSPLDMSHNKDLTTHLVSISYPSSYDLRTLGRVTPVKNQVIGTCWAFATYGSLESWFLGKPGTETWDFSENNLKNCHGFDWAHDEGGNRGMSTAYLARWSGPINESDDPYNPYSAISPSGLKEKKHLETVLMIPDRTGPTNNDNIKQAVMDYGAMYTTMYWNDSYYHSTNTTYYYPGGSYSNHVVAIVGWDDNFDKNLFKSIPSGNGAWIIKNSWGDAWGENGYFYISYYDSRIGKENASFINAENFATNSTNYQYDPLGNTIDCGYSSNTGWGANIFIPTANGTLTAISFYANAINTSYTIYIYDTFTGSSFTGLLGSKTGRFAYVGYHTVNLTSPIPLKEGDNFAIVVKFITPGYNYPIPIEMPILNYSSGARANPGESYVSQYGTTWTDITTQFSNTNVCIKGIVGYLSSTPFQITTTSLPSGMVSIYYRGSLTATGGIPPYCWSYSGNLPTGLILGTATGIISGIPTTAGTFTFTAQVSDYVGSSTYKGLSIYIVSLPPLEITTTSLPTGIVNSTYRGTLTATGGVLPYRWLIISGTLPVGLNLDTATGIISGIPTTADTFTFTAQVSDYVGSSTYKGLSIYIGTMSGMIIYVSITGDDNNSGTDINYPKRTISAGVDACPVDGMVSVSAGTYNEAVYINKGIALIGVGTPTITAQGLGHKNTVTLDGTNTDSASISGFSITGANGTSSYGNGIYCKNAAPSITNNTISGNDWNGIYCDYYSSPAITNNTISGNDWNGIYCDYHSSPAITNNTISENDWNGIYCDYSSSPAITNNTISENSKDGISCNNSSLFNNTSALSSIN